MHTVLNLYWSICLDGRIPRALILQVVASTMTKKNSSQRIQSADAFLLPCFSFWYSLLRLFAMWYQLRLPHYIMLTFHTTLPTMIHSVLYERAVTTRTRWVCIIYIDYVHTYIYIYINVFFFCYYVQNVRSSRSSSWRSVWNICVCVCCC